MGMNPLGKGLNCFRKPRFLQTFPNPFFINMTGSLGHIFRNRGTKQRIVLEDGTEQPVVFRPVKRPNVLTVQEYPPFCGVKKATQKLYKRCLSRTVQASPGWMVRFMLVMVSFSASG